MKDLRLRLAQNYGAVLALALFVLMFGIYVGNHAAGLTVPVVTTAANKGVLLALVAMAQTLPILTGGLDLSVGMVSSCATAWLRPWWWGLRSRPPWA
jgi:ribose transport system permease protein